VETTEQIDAKKGTLDQEKALELTKNVDHIYATKGKKTIHLDLRSETPDEDALLQLILGPTGNLRAPTIRVGRVLLVGFDDQTYQKVLKL